MRPLTDTVERVLDRIASTQHGNVTRQQLLGAGVSAQQIKRRMRKGLLIPQFPGVYRVGHCAPSVRSHYMAAVLACGAGAVLSGRAAAWLLALIAGPAPAPEVTARGRHALDGVITRRGHLPEREWRFVERIPVTTPARTMVDVARVLSDDELALTFHRAGVKYGTKPWHVEAVLKRYPTAPGARRLRLVIHGDVHVTLSKLEKCFLSLLREENLPLPETNRRVDTKTVDCRWPEHRLTVELQSYRFHNSRHSWKQDYVRRAEARARGDQFRTYIWEEVTDRDPQMIRELRELLGRPRLAA